MSTLVNISILAINLLQISAIHFPKSITKPQILPQNITEPSSENSCNCGVFLSGQLHRNSNNKEPIGYAPIYAGDFEEIFPCNELGHKQCTDKCVQTLVKHLSKSGDIICGSIDRDCYRERGYLFVRNCNSSWKNTNLSAGKEICCKDGVKQICPTGR